MATVDKLPKKLIPIDNPDKKFHEKWDTKRDMLNFPHPYRAILVGVPNCGKSTTMMNIIVRANPPFQKLVVIHADWQNTHEYDSLGTGDDSVSIIGHIPPPEEIAGDVKTLIVIDDLDFKAFNKNDISNVCKLFSYVSTHKNVSIMLSRQTFHDIPIAVRRCSNLFIFWPNHDTSDLERIARKVNLTPKQFVDFMGMLNGPKQSFWIDRTPKSPYPYRLNGYEKIAGPP
jgi:hypothetical protein